MPKYTEEDAIAMALSQNWKTAIEINCQLDKNNPNNVEVLNRLAYAYLKTGQFSQAKLTYQKVLTLDPYNQIALKNSQKIGQVKKKDLQKQKTHQLSPMVFLEEPGKTKIVPCVNTAPVQVISTLTPGQEVFLKAKNHCVEVRDANNVYLAALPDDLSFKLIKLLSAGNLYLTIVKSTGKNQLIIMLRELKRGRRFAHQPSFVNSGMANLSGGFDKLGERPESEESEEDTEKSIEES